MIKLLKLDSWFLNVKIFFVIIYILVGKYILDILKISGLRCEMNFLLLSPVFFFVLSISIGQKFNLITFFRSWYEIIIGWDFALKKKLLSDFNNWEIKLLMEINKKANWTQNPTRKNVTLYIIFTSIASLLILLSITDFFTENPFQRRNTIMFMLLTSSLWACINIIRNYTKNNKD